jgi:hypothetical protein
VAGKTPSHAGKLTLPPGGSRPGPALPLWPMATRSAATSIMVASTLPLKPIGANVGETNYRWQLPALPDDFDIMFFAGIRVGAYNVKDLQALGLK